MKWAYRSQDIYSNFRVDIYWAIGLLDYIVDLIFEETHTIFCNRCTAVDSYQRCRRILVSPHSSSIFLIMLIVSWNWLLYIFIGVLVFLEHEVSKSRYLAYIIWLVTRRLYETSVECFHRCLNQTSGSGWEVSHFQI